MTAPDDLDRLRALCDELVATHGHPTLARVALVKVWALGMTAADDLLSDLEALAIAAGLHSGVELTAPELMDCFGHPDRAERIRAAVREGRARHLDAAGRARRLIDVHAARDVA